MANGHKIQWYKGIQTRMSCLLIVTTTLILTGFMWIYYQQAHAQMDRDLNASAEFFVNHLSISLIKPLWDMDEQAIHSLLDATMDEKQIYTVIVKEFYLGENYGQTRDNQWNRINIADDDEASGIIVYNGLISREMQIKRNEIKLGEVKMYLTPKFMQENLNSAIRNMIVMLIMLNTILILLLFVSIRKIIITPIQAIALYLRRISGGDTPEVIVKSYKGEFDEIRDCLNLLIQATHQTTMAAEDIAAGNLGIQITERSEHDRMMKALNLMIRRLNEIMHETETMIRAVGSGQLEVRGNAEAFQGGWRELINGINHLISELSGAVSTAAMLSNEMALARKIQTSLLPTISDNLHPDLEIAAEMLPADQVGGDFYDISFDRSGLLWFSIGDVSGHGVTPGLIMMMAQTVHTTITSGFDCDASGAVSMINYVLYKNVNERLNETHFMTLTALKYLGDGQFQYSGAHLTMIVYRRQTNSFEFIKTRGIYLNFKKDISKSLNNDNFSLNPGDILVLYTDGLTEAHNQAGEILDLDRLVTTIEKHIHLSLNDMKDKIIADVLHWCSSKIADDMTILIVKRK